MAVDVRERPPMTALTPLVPDPTQDGASALEQVVIQGNLAQLNPLQRVAYYRAVCESVGLNPLTKPFEYITLNGKLTLYATAGATAQLRSLRAVSVDRLDRDLNTDAGLYTVTARGRDRSGRTDESTGVVAIKGLQGEPLANALMKAETKAKRRLTLSLAGLGFLDEVEVESIPGAWRADVDVETGEIPVETSKRLTLEERLAEQAKAAEDAVTTSRPEDAGHVASDGSEAAAIPPATAKASAEPVVQPSATDSADVEDGEFTEAPAADEINPATQVCGEVPAKDNPLDMTVACSRAPGHKGPHASTEGSWPQSVK